MQSGILERKFNCACQFIEILEICPQTIYLSTLLRTMLKKMKAKKQPKFNEDCIFCKIAQKKAVASIIYEDKDVISFMDIRPVNVGHVLVISKKHYRDVLEMPLNEACALFKAVRIVAEKVKHKMQADGISIISSNGRSAQQDVFHAHAHVIPRFEADKIRDIYAAMMKPLLIKPTRAQLEETAKKIKR